MIRPTIDDIRREFAKLYANDEFVIDKKGGKVVEIVNANFIADQASVFGEVNWDYIERELAWYMSGSLCVNDIPAPVPKIWTQVADKDGFINSNYGHLVFSEQNNYQFDHVYTELQDRPDSRRAIMIYTRPTIWGDHNKNGRSDFICTNSVQYLIRNNKVDAIVSMRSNDLVFGYKNDLAWQKFVLHCLVDKLNKSRLEDNQLEYGDIHWNAGSLHIYASQFYLIDHYIKTGETSITKKDYEKLYSVEKKVS